MAQSEDCVDLLLRSGGETVAPLVELETLLAAHAPRAHRAGLELIVQGARDLPARVTGPTHTFLAIVSLLIEEAIVRADRGEVIVRLGFPPPPDRLSPFAENWAAAPDRPAITQVPAICGCVKPRERSSSTRGLPSVIATTVSAP